MNDIDLIVSSVTAPLYVNLGETIPVSWTVKNLGTDSALANYWPDYIYISNDQFLDDSDTFVLYKYGGQNTPLASGSSYTATSDVFIPDDVGSGIRYLLFIANKDNYQYETNKTNNLFAQAFTVNDPPDLDLVITAANAPATAGLGETISVSWTVTNQGTVSALADWYDYIYISDDQFFDESDYRLTDGYTRENKLLASGSSYTITEDISIDSFVAPGDRYLLFVADKDHYQGETDETNNVFAKAITINNAPDLVVTAANAPTTAALRETISVSWTVTNQGTVSALAYYWYDAVYISDDQFFDKSDTQLASHETRENTPLASGSSYTVSQDISIGYYVDVAPGDVYDGLRQRYLLFVADKDHYQGETDETNNVFAQAITISAPDLVITAANAPTTATLGETISVSWTVTNLGTVSTFFTSDYIYISDDQFFDQSDTLISEYSGWPLAAADSYTATNDIYIPEYIGGGDRYLLFVANGGKNQVETNETNNIFAQAITISNDVPDLVITAVNAPTTAALGETISVSWTVKNQGIVSAFADWDDRVYISDDQFFDQSDTYLTERYTGENTPLISGDSYTATEDIYIDNYDVATGDVYDGLRQRYLLFVADRYNYQGETNETNNVFAQAITISNDVPDLVITAANAPTTAALGETISVSWTVKNQGLVSAFADWYDRVYISDDQFFDESDTYLTERYTGENTPLAAAGSYTATQDISIPDYGKIGDVYDGLRQRYLLFVADRGGMFGNNQGETNETNNVFAQAITLTNPDLVITAANAPTTAGLNETISVSWTVKNQGIVSAFANWYDAVYISDDQFFDESDTQLTSRYTGEDTPLVSGGSYTATQDIDIPDYLATGDRYLLFVTDRYYGNNQTETDETNNVFAQAITLSAPDLVISAANAPTTAALGETISASWTVTNLGIVSAFANWSDYIYISDDQFFDSSDTFRTSRYTGEDTPLASGDSYTATEDISIPNSVGTGDRYLLFVADGYYSNYQGETDETNNVFAQVITINAPDLVVTAANAPTTAALGETISVSWTVTNLGIVSAFANWSDYIYISDDQFFDSSDTYLTNRDTGENTPLVSGGSYTATQDISIPNNVVAGDRYLLFVADGGYNNQGETDESNNVFAQGITINAPDLVVSAANAPTTAALGETISVSWTVTNQGIVSAFADSYDYIYISDDQFFDESDRYLNDRYTGENTPLASGDSYTATQKIYIDNSVGTGDVYDGLRQRYLLFVANGGYYNQGETDETNNVRAVAISLYAEDEIFNGTSGRDTLTGSDSNNLITGLQGADTLTGGAGSDRFVYTSIRDAGDTITDFVAGTDKIDLTQLLQSVNLGNLNYESATTQGYLSFGTTLSNTTVLIDIDGTTGRARPTPLLTVEGVSQNTLAQSDNFLL